eukprot:PITA_04840
MQGIHPSTCIHHIYRDDKLKPVRQPQRRMNSMMKEIVKEEQQKLLNVGFIYPISVSQWASPLVIVPKKNGKWRVCVDYRELNKATLKDHFPLPFIDQVLDSLAGKKYFCFLDGFSGYNQIRIATEDQDKTTFKCPWGTYAYKVFLFGLCNAPATFQRAVLAIFVDLVHECVEVYMDDFTVYGNTYDDCLKNLEKVLERCIETNLSLSNEKCYMMLTEGIVLRHHISASGIKVDPAKIQVLVNLMPPTTQKEILQIIFHLEDFQPNSLASKERKLLEKVLGRPIISDEMSLKPQVLIEPFEQWALDFVGPINPPSNGKRYILVCMDYVTKWVEAKAVRREKEDIVVTFLFE